MTSVVEIFFYFFFDIQKPLTPGIQSTTDFNYTTVWNYLQQKCLKVKKIKGVVGGAGLLIFNSSFPLLLVKFSISSRVIFNLKFLDAFVIFQGDCKTRSLWSYQGTVSRKAFWHRSEEERHLEMLHAERAHKWAYLLGGFARFKGTLFISLDSLTLTDHLISH